MPNARNRYYGFEPDLTNYAKLSATGHHYGGTFIGVNAGLGASDGLLSFLAGGGVDRNFMDAPVGGAKAEVPVYAIDSFFAHNESPTFIKMDIEGMEPDALRGAEETIRAHAPTLAVCVYHRPEHLWEIPQMVRDWVPAYRLSLRHYSTNMSETVMFAVCD
jgi:FkbM family methyltransferase